MIVRSALSSNSLARPDARLLAGREKARARAEDRDALVARHAPEHARIRLQRRAVEQHDRRAGGERARERVPHHPAAGREVEVAVVRPHVGVQRVLLQLLQQRAAGAVHDALRHAGRAGRIQDEGRMIERQLRERQRRVRRCRSRRTATASSIVSSAGRSSQIRHEHDALDAGDLLLDRAHGRHAIDASCRRSDSRRRRTAPSA